MDKCLEKFIPFKAKASHFFYSLTWKGNNSIWAPSKNSIFYKLSVNIDKRELLYSIMVGLIPHSIIIIVKAVNVSRAFRKRYLPTEVPSLVSLKKMETHDKNFEKHVIFRSDIVFFTKNCCWID